MMMMMMMMINSAWTVMMMMMMINSALTVSRAGARANYKTRPENGPKTSVRRSGYGTLPNFSIPKVFE
jgi:hypothetical protein